MKVIGHWSLVNSVCFRLFAFSSAPLRLCGIILILSSVSCLLTPDSRASTIGELRLPVDVARPQSLDVPLYHGETIDLASRVSQYAVPMDLTGGRVLFHARTNGMPINTSYQITGAVGRASSPGDSSNGWATVRICVDRDLPVVSSMSWTLVVSSTNGDLCRIHGSLTISGTSAGSIAVARPSIDCDPAGSAQVVSNALSVALSVHTNRIDNPHGTTPGQIGAVTPVDASNIVFGIQTPVTNDLWSAIAGAPRWPTYDWGTHSNVVFVLSNSVLYLLNN
jgi:hypothetical protein